MINATLDPSKQLAVQHPVPLPAFPRAMPLSTGRGLMSTRQFELPAADERALLFVAPHHGLSPMAGLYLAAKREFAASPVQFVIREPRRSASTLGEGATVTPTRPTEPTRQERDVLPFLMAVRRFIEAEHLMAAREMLEAAPIHILSDPLVAKLRSILTPPIVERVQKRDVDRSLEYAWLRTAGRKYRGHWVALEGSDLLAVAANLRELREVLRTMSLAHPPLLHRVD